MVLKLLLIFICVVSFLAKADDAITLKVFGNHAPPYRIFKEGHASGVYVDTFREICRQLGIQVTFIEAPVARALSALEHGSADLILGANYTPERNLIGEYTQSYFPAEVKTFYLAENSKFDIKVYEDLISHQIVVVNGQKYFDRFDSDKRLKVTKVNSHLQALKLVEAGQYPVTIVPNREGEALIRNNSLKLKKASLSIEGKNSFILISKKSKAIKLKNEISKKLQQLKKNGYVEALYRKYSK